jgi:hypothetical protein
MAWVSWVKVCSDWVLRPPCAPVSPLVSNSAGDNQVAGRQHGDQAVGSAFNQAAIQHKARLPFGGAQLNQRFTGRELCAPAVRDWEFTLLQLKIWRAAGH